jgi:hypothetical protein
MVVHYRSALSAVFVDAVRLRQVWLHFSIMWTFCDMMKACGESRSECKFVLGIR